MGALDGVRVLELPGRLAGPLTGWLLADQGADVVAVRPSAPGTHAEAALDRNKRIVPSGAEVLAARADVVIGDVEVDLSRTIQVRLPAFAATDPLAAIPDLGEGLPGAAVGLYDLLPVGPPRYFPFCVASLTASLTAACGVAAALLSRASGRGGQRIEVPLADAALQAQELAALMTVDPPRCWPTLQWAATPFIGGYRCSDGRWLYLHAGLPHHLERLLKALRAAGCDRAEQQLRRTLTDPTRADPSSVATVAEARALHGQLSGLFAERPASAWEEVLAGAGVCAVLVRSAGEWRDHPHPRHEQLVVEVHDPDLGRFAQPGPQVTLAGTPGPLAPRVCHTVDEVLQTWPEPGPVPTGDAPEQPLAGLRVLDLSQVIAGPVCGRVLAELSAEVVKVESPRLTAPWVEAFHALFDAGKDSVSVDLSDEAQRASFGRWVRDWQPDVLVHNFLPAACETLGIAEDQLCDVLPGLVWTAISAWGHEGPWGGRPGWEQTAQAACGMQADYGGDGSPDLCPVPANDACTGLSAAFGTLCALVARLRDGCGQRVDARLASTAWLLQLPHVLGPIGRAPVSARGGAARGDAAGHRFVQCRDGWAFLATTAPLQALWQVEGLEPLRMADPAELPGLLERLLAQDEIWTWAERLAASSLAERAAIVPRARLGEALSLRHARWRRSELDGIGAVTEIASPLRMTGQVLQCPEPAHRRGSDTEARLGLAAAPLPEIPERTALWWLGMQARWGAYLASRRLASR